MLAAPPLVEQVEKPVEKQGTTTLFEALCSFIFTLNSCSKTGFQVLCSSGAKPGRKDDGRGDVWWSFFGERGAAAPRGRA